MGVRGAGGVSGILDWDADDPLLSCERGGVRRRRLQLRIAVGLSGDVLRGEARERGEANRRALLSR